MAEDDDPGAIFSANSEVARAVRRAFAETSETAQRRFGCLSEQEVAGYADGRLAANDRARLEKHLAACNECTEQVAVLVHLAAQPLPDVSSACVPRAAELVRPHKPRSWLALRWALAGAAVVSIAIFGNMWLHPGLQNGLPVVTQPAPGSGSIPPAGAQPPRAVTGGGAALSSAPDLIAPAAGLPVSAGSTVVSWHPVPGATVYHLNVTTVDGDKVAVTSTLKTSVLLPPTVRILPGYRYYMWVTADLDTGKTVGSKPLLFTGQ